MQQDIMNEIIVLFFYLASNLQYVKQRQNAVKQIAVLNTGKSVSGFSKSKPEKPEVPEAGPE